MIGSAIAVLVLIFCAAVFLGLVHLIGANEAVLFSALAVARLT